MQLRDNGLRFSPITIVLHWVVVLLLLAIIATGFFASQAQNEIVRLDLKRMQNLFGTLMFIVSAYRFWARVSSYHPLPVGTPNPIEVIISRSMATALALAMVLLPVAAWLSMSAAGKPVELLGGVVIPALIAPNETVRQVVDVLYNIGATAFSAGLALHIFGAFKNHFLLKNDTLRRMFGKHVEL